MQRRRVSEQRLTLSPPLLRLLSLQTKTVWVLSGAVESKAHSITEKKREIEMGLTFSTTEWQG